MIYTVGGIKGGSGKTTIATNLAIFLAHQKHDVIMVDADDQETASDFTSIRHQTFDGNLGYTAVKIKGRDLNSNVARLAEKYDDVVIDAGGRDTVSQRSALTVSHIYLIPFAPRSFDVWTLRKVEELANEILPLNPELACLSFINRADARGSYKEEVAELLRESQTLHFLATSIGNRISFSNASTIGQGVVEFKPTDKKAISEIASLNDEINNFLKNRKKKQKKGS